MMRSPSDSVRVRDLNVFIIRSNEENSCESALLERVTKALCSIGVKSIVLHDSDPLPLSEDDKGEPAVKNIFVMSPFSGHKFNELAKMRARIIKPLIVLNALDTPGGIVYNSNFPVHSYALAGVIASTSGLDNKTRNRMHSKIVMMGGRFSRNFVRGVTHLICANGASQKYKMAFRLEVPVVLPEWVDAIWQISSSENVQLDDDRLKPLSFGVFQNCVISVTGLTYETRESIRRLVEDQGGQFSYEFSNKCTHLVCNVFAGRKCEMAKRHGIPVLSVNWVNDSLRSRYLLDHDLYIMNRADEQRTETGLSSAIASCVSLKSTCNANPEVPSFFITQSDIDDTSSNDSATLSKLVLSLPPYSVHAKIIKQARSKIDKFTKETLRCSIFTGLTFYMDGMDEIKECVFAAIRLCGGSLSPHLTPAVTHLISGRTDLSVVHSLVRSTGRLSNCTVNSLNWLTDSMGARAILNVVPQDENSYDLRMSAMRGTWVEANELETPLNCYKQESIFASAFDNKRVVLLGFNKTLNADLGNLVKSCKGFVSTDVNAYPKWDIVLCPVIIPAYSIVQANAFLTDKWIQASLSSKALVSPSACVFFTPICQQNWTSKPLRQCTVAVSGFTGPVKDGLFYIGRKLGAAMLDNLVKPTNKNGSTHLLTREARGAKFKAAKAWRMPIVGLSWLLASLVENAAASEQEYSIEASNQGELYASVEAKIRQCRKHYGISDDIASQLGDGMGSLCQLSVLGPSQRFNNSSQAGAELAGSLLLVEDTNSGLDAAEHTTLSPSRYAFDAHASSQAIESNNAQLTFTGCIEDVGDSFFSSKDNHEGFFTSSTPNQTSSVKQIVTPSVTSVSLSTMSDKSLLKYREQCSPEKKVELDSSPSNKLSQVEVSESSMDRLVTMLHDKLEGTDPFKSENSLKKKADHQVSCLAGCRIVASKRLSIHHVEYNRLATAMGAAFQSVYNNACTHFIFQGRINDTSKEYKTAVSDRKKIVSPRWLFECYNNWKWVDEVLYPHCYDPERKLDIRRSGNASRLSGDRGIVSDLGSADSSVIRELLMSAELDESTNLEAPVCVSEAKASVAAVDVSRREEQSEVSIQWVDEDADMIREQMSRQRVFCFSGLKTCKRDELESKVQLIGATLSTSDFTHLVTESLTRGERFLTALAKTGCWILRPEYVLDCERAGHFVDEDRYEWTADGDGLAGRLCRAAQHWRLAGERPFMRWPSVRLLQSSSYLGRSANFEQRLQSLARTLRAGGAGDVQVLKTADGMPPVAADCLLFADDRAFSMSERQLWLDHLNYQNFYKLEYIAAVLIEFERSPESLAEEYSIKSNWNRQASILTTASTGSSSEELSRKRRLRRDQSHPTRKKTG